MTIHYLALGHHGDDQIETILMRLTRGSQGKQEQEFHLPVLFLMDIIFRPFLSLTKEEIQQYCQTAPS